MLACASFPDRSRSHEDPANSQRSSLWHGARIYNALRLAHAVVKQDASAQITVFLMGDAVLAAKAQQATPDGYYNVERMLKRMLSSNGRVLLCGTCLDARGIVEAELIDGGQRSTMDELAAATASADRVLVF
jgi:uncharacterized protein involved in oxidation of intracellular sulfur